MNTLYLDLRRGLVVTLLLGVITCGVYPLVTTGLAQWLFPTHANGSLVHDAQGRVVGSALLGQNFRRPEYFHPRPSAAGEAGYDTLHSGGSNFGPTSRQLAETIESRITAYRSENHLNAQDPVPPDAVTASGSGLDPHISPANAKLQVARVAAARGWEAREVDELVERFTEKPLWGLFGEPGVNVLRLNMALDAARGR